MVARAENGERALKILDQYSVNLLLTDVVMPGMNGRKLADEVKRKHSDLRVLSMTGTPECDRASGAFGSGRRFDSEAAVYRATDQCRPEGTGSVKFCRGQ
jgi:DNA-binding NtrC family response regulator